MSNFFISNLCWFLVSFYFFAGLKDDIIGISSNKKFVAQIVAAFITIYWGDIRISSWHGVFGIEHLHYWASILFGIIAVIGITNAINLIDGIDGLAGGLGLIIRTAFGVWLFTNGEKTFSTSGNSLVRPDKLAAISP